MSARAEWLAERRTGVGGSDAAPVLGMSKWSTPLAVYEDKRGLAPELEDNEAMLWGRVLEPVVRDQYAQRTGRVVTVPTKMVRHPKFPWMLANLDGRTNDGRVYEGKTARSGQEWGEPGTDQVPVAYLFQVQHYMAVTALPVADIAVLIGGSDFRIYEIRADIELQEMIIDGEAQFWSHVEQGIPPDPVTFADMQAMYGRASVAAEVEATAALLGSVEQIKMLGTCIADMERQLEDQKTLVMKALKKADTLSYDGVPLVTWRAAKGRQTLDAEKLQLAHPDIYLKYLKTGEPSRRFLIK